MSVRQLRLPGCHSPTSLDRGRAVRTTHTNLALASRTAMPHQIKAYAVGKAKNNRTRGCKEGMWLVIQNVSAEAVGNSATVGVFAS